MYIFYAQAEQEAAVAAWLAPLQVVRPAWSVLGGEDSEGAHRRHACRNSATLDTHAQFLLPLSKQPGARLVPQMQDPDLGARMGHAMQHAFSQGHQRVAIVGTDVPDLTAGIVGRALQSLDAHQARTAVYGYGV